MQVAPLAADGPHASWLTNKRWVMLPVSTTTYKGCPHFCAQNQIDESNNQAAYHQMGLISTTIIHCSCDSGALPSFVSLSLSVTEKQRKDEQMPAIFTVIVCSSTCIYIHLYNVRILVS